MEASSKVEAIASVRARKATTEEQAPLVLHHAQVQPKVAVDNLVEPLHRSCLQTAVALLFLHAARPLPSPLLRTFQSRVCRRPRQRVSRPRRLPNSRSCQRTS
jgi:hypothetical protein